MTEILNQRRQEVLGESAVVYPHLRNKNHPCWRYPIATSGHKSEEWPFSFPSLMRDLRFPGGQGDGLSLGPVGNLTRSQGSSSNNYLTSGETTAEQRQDCRRGSGSTLTETYRKRRQEFYVFSFKCSVRSVDPHCRTRARTDCSWADPKLSIEQFHSGEVPVIASFLVYVLNWLALTLTGCITFTTEKYNNRLLISVKIWAGKRNECSL